MNSGLHWVDGAIIVVYACGMLAIGAYYSLHQKDSDEYFVGSRAMSPFLIGVSLFATLFSTIGYLSYPGEIIRHGPVILTGVLSIPVSYYVVGHLMLPVYMQYNATSAYELLEAKLGLRIRLLGATLFVLLRLIWMSTLIFFASKAMLTMLGLDEKWLILIMLVISGVAIGYSSIGGLRAVVITDLLQFFLLFGGAVLVITIVTYRMGGFDWIPSQWNNTWDTQPLFGPPKVRITVFGAIIYGVAWSICTAGSDQVVIQRFLATGSARASRRSFLFNCLANVAVALVLVLLGFSLLGYYQSDLQRLGPGMTIADNADSLFPYFISHHLPVGLSGLVVAGLFAAAMSSIDSGINSITAVVMTDFVERFRKDAMKEQVRVLFSRLLALTIGLVVIATGSLLQIVPGNFIEISQRTIGLFVTPLFTLFFVGLFVKKSTEWAAILGSLVSLLTAGFVAFWEDPVTGDPMISFQWIIPFSLIAGVVTGYLFSRSFTRR